MSVARLRRKAILVPLDDFTYWIDEVRYNLLTTICTYFRRLTDLYSARLSLYIRCDYYPQKIDMPKTYDSLLAKTRELRETGYHYVAYISHDYISNPKIPKPWEGFNWADLEENLCFVKFEKDQWELAGVRAGRDPFQSAIFYGNTWLLSHEMAHLIGWELGRYLHTADYIAMQSYKYYDELFDTIPNPDWDKVNWSYIAEEMPPKWFTS